MAKVRPPLFTEAIHISDPTPCIQILLPGLGWCNPVTTSHDANPDWQKARTHIPVINSWRRPISVVTGFQRQSPVDLRCRQVAHVLEFHMGKQLSAGCGEDPAGQSTNVGALQDASVFYLSPIATQDADLRRSLARWE